MTRKKGPCQDETGLGTNQSNQPNWNFWSNDPTFATTYRHMRPYDYKEVMPGRNWTWCLYYFCPALRVEWSQKINLLLYGFGVTPHLWLLGSGTLPLESCRVIWKDHDAQLRWSYSQIEPKFGHTNENDWVDTNQWLYHSTGHRNIYQLVMPVWVLDFWSMKYGSIYLNNLWPIVMAETGFDANALILVLSISLINSYKKAMLRREVYYDLDSYSCRIAHDIRSTSVHTGIK